MPNLRSCPDCGEMMSPRAFSCPSCGARSHALTWSAAVSIILVLLALAFLWPV